MCLFQMLTPSFKPFNISKSINPISERMPTFKEIPVLRTPKEVRYMLGLTRYYCEFIHKYADLVQPLIQLTHKTIPFTWTGQCQEVFNMLKKILMKNPI